MKIGWVTTLSLGMPASGCEVKGSAEPTESDAAVALDADSRSESGQMAEADIEPSVRVTILASGTGTPAGLAVGGGNAYFLEGSGGPFPPGGAPPGGGLYWVPTSGESEGGALLPDFVDAASSEFRGPFGLAMDDANLYWANEGSQGHLSGVPDGSVLEGGIRRVSRDGGVSTLLASGIATGGVALDESAVYWIQSSESDGSIADGALMKVAKTGGPVVTLAPGVVSSAIAVDDKSAYVMMQKGIVKVDKTSGSVTVLASRQNPWGVLAVNATSVYWTELTVGVGPVQKIYSVPLSGGTAEVLSDTDGSPSCIAVDDTNIYWTTDRAVQKMGLGGGPAVTLASASGGASLISVDSTSVYWVDMGGLGSS